MLVKICENGLSYIAGESINGHLLEKIWQCLLKFKIYITLKKVKG